MFMGRVGVGSKTFISKPWVQVHNSKSPIPTWNGVFDLSVNLPVVLIFILRYYL